MRRWGRPRGRQSFVMSPLLRAAGRALSPVTHAILVHGLPSIVNGLMRLVTIAVTCTLPRGVDGPFHLLDPSSGELVVIREVRVVQLGQLGGSAT